MQLQWFWRAVVADACAIVPLWVYVGLAGPNARDTVVGLVVTGLFVIATSIPMLWVYHYLTYWHGPWRNLDQEIRCRKCRYILRGITEPRCPECGERI